MTARAIILGLVLSVLLTGFAWVNDSYLCQSPVAADMIPSSVYGLVIFGLLVLNPLLYWFRLRPFQTKEWATIIALLLVAVVVAGPALMRPFTPAVLLPHMWGQVESSWQRLDLLGHAPDALLVSPGDPATPGFDQAVYGFRTGLADPSTPLDPAAVPWWAWWPTLLFWLPILAMLGIGGICLMTVVHPQWAQRERLPYPIAEFAGSLLEHRGQQLWPSMFYRRSFWLGFLPVLAVFLINGSAAWLDDMVEVPLVMDFTPALKQWPGLKPVPDLAGWLLRPRLVFVAVGFSYFISSDIALTIGLSPVLFGGAFLALYGMDMNPRAGTYLGGAIEGYQRFGAYLGLALALGYTGRRYYADVLRRMLGFRSRDPLSPHIVWSARAVAVCGIGIAVLLWQRAELHPALAVLFVALLGMLFLVLARICAETGLFSIHVWWHPVGIVLGAFGFAALGPNTLLSMAILCAVLTISPMVSMTAMSANALRIGELAGVRTGRLAPWLAAGSVIALLAGVGGTLIGQYSLGVSDPGWAGDTASREPFEILANQLQTYSGSTEGWDVPRWDLVRPNGQFLAAAAVGLALVSLFSFLRLRFHWWFLHPVLFLVWGTWPVAVLSASFVLGWTCKTLILKLGGRTAYDRAKPVFVGLVAGELFAGLFWSVWGVLYCVLSGHTGPAFQSRL